MPGDESNDAIFVLGRSWDELTPDERRRRGSSKRFALVALVVVAAIVALSITLVAVLVDTSPGPPASPRAAAQKWADAVVHGDRSGQRRLQCKDARTADVLSLILYAPTGAHAGRAVRRATGRWSVPVTFDEAGGSSNGASVTVVLRDKTYLVC